MRTIRITGTGSALPGRIVTNKELEQLVETSDEWIRERTGIAERHVSVGETVVTLASEAARKALEQAGKTAEEIDLILVASCSPEQYLPCCACQVQAAIGAVNALAFDVNAACSGFLFALNTADAYLRTGLAENALVIGSDARDHASDDVARMLKFNQLIKYDSYMWNYVRLAPQFYKEFLVQMAKEFQAA